MLWNLETLDLMKEITKFEPEKRRWITGLLWRNPKRKVRNTNEARALAVAKSLEKKYLKADAILAKYPSNNTGDGFQGFLTQINNTLLEFLTNKFVTLATAEEKAMTKNHYYMQFHAVVEEGRNTRMPVVLNAAS